jgi:glycosyltransferase involved in cell wall biosynthesis
MKELRHAADLDWNSRIDLQHQHIIVQKMSTGRTPLVTIGLPTYHRPHTIRRALASLARQTYRDFTVVISDNAGVDHATIDAVREFEPLLPEVHLVAQPFNIGAVGNLKFVLSCATTKYFMWLADDDEITPDYLQELVALLEEDHAAPAASGAWHASRGGHAPRAQKQVRMTQKNRVARMFNYVVFQNEDSLFYGLHRTECLRRCHFTDYVYPNRGVLTNFCYVFLFDQIWQGHIRYSNNAAWISHSEPEKSYSVASVGGVVSKMKGLMRRGNVYALYLSKAARRSPLMLVVLAPAAAIGLGRDIACALARVAVRLHGRIDSGIHNAFNRLL